MQNSTRNNSPRDEICYGRWQVTEFANATYLQSSASCTKKKFAEDEQYRNLNSERILLTRYPVSRTVFQGHSKIPHLPDEVDQILLDKLNEECFSNKSIIVSTNFCLTLNTNLCQEEESTYIIEDAVMVKTLQSFLPWGWLSNCCVTDSPADIVTAVTETS